MTVLADEYDKTRFNKTNDLWIDPKGGVYFSDPAYGGAQVVQDGEHVYYITPDRTRVSRVIDDMVRPNGLIGTPEGKTLYVTDAGARETFRYRINDDGTLSDKRLFVSVGSDGMTIDTEGNVYLTEDGVLAFDPAGKLIERIAVANRPTNVCFAGSDRRTLFITARSSVYSIRMRVEGVPPWTEAGPRGNIQRPDDGRHFRPPELRLYPIRRSGLDRALRPDPRRRAQFEERLLQDAQPGETRPGAEAFLRPVVAPRAALSTKRPEIDGGVLPESPAGPDP